jgi:hypothetical protein
VTPQPRPRDKRDEAVEEDEVLTPDGVAGPDEPLPPARPDRRPLWALIAGLSAVWFAFLGSILSFVLAPTAMVLGWKAMKRIDVGEGLARDRTKAKVGFIAGIAATAFIVVQVVLFALFFEWDKSDEPSFNDEKPTVTTAAEAAPTTTLG